MSSRSNPYGGYRRGATGTRPYDQYGDPQRGEINEFGERMGGGLTTGSLSSGGVRTGNPFQDSATPNLDRFQATQRNRVTPAQPAEDLNHHLQQVTAAAGNAFAPQPLTLGAAPATPAPILAPQPVRPPQTVSVDAPAAVAASALPSNPDDRALLMQTRARDNAARQSEPIPIPAGDPAARAFYGKRDSTPSPNTVPIDPRYAVAGRPSVGVVARGGSNAYTGRIMDENGDQTRPTMQRLAAEDARAPLPASPAPINPINPAVGAAGMAAGAMPPIRPANPFVAAPAAAPAVQPAVAPAGTLSGLTSSIAPAPPAPAAPPMQVNPAFAGQMAQLDASNTAAVEERKRRDAAARAAIAPIQSPDDSNRPKARSYARRNPYAMQ